MDAQLPALLVVFPHGRPFHLGLGGQVVVVIQCLLVMADNPVIVVPVRRDQVVLLFPDIVGIEPVQEIKSKCRRLHDRILRQQPGPAKEQVRRIKGRVLPVRSRPISDHIGFPVNIKDVLDNIRAFESRIIDIIADAGGQVPFTDDERKVPHPGFRYDGFFPKKVVEQRFIVRIPPGILVKPVFLPLIGIEHDRQEIRPAVSQVPSFQEFQALFGAHIHTDPISADLYVLIAVLDRFVGDIEEFNVPPVILLLISPALVKPELHPPFVEHVLPVVMGKMTHKGPHQALPFHGREVIHRVLLPEFRVADLIMDRARFDSKFNMRLQPHFQDKIKDGVDLAEIVVLLFRADEEILGEQAPEPHILKPKRFPEEHQVLPRG